MKIIGKEEETFSEKKKAILHDVKTLMDYSRDIADEELKESIDDVLDKDEQIKTWRVAYRKKLAEEIFYSLRGWDILQQLLDQEDITEIMVNRYDRIFIERDGKLQPCKVKFESEEKLRDVIERMVSKCNRMVNDAMPIVDARLPGGERINVVLPPVSVEGAVLTIRKFSPCMTNLQNLVQLGAMSDEVATLLIRLVRAGYNILISGGTGSGKTTLLGALGEFIPEEERVITIEDSIELIMPKISNLVRMETRNANLEGSREITIKDLLRTALRMRPSRIIIGEVRGGEAADLLQCLNTGHAGSMSTGHANSAKDMLGRLETMALMGMDLPLAVIRAQIAASIEIIVHLGRLMDGSRKVLEICEVTGMREGQIELNRIYLFKETGKKEGKIQGIYEKEKDILRDRKLKIYERTVSP